MEKIIIMDRINTLRKHMKKNGISLYMLTTTDFHMSEYTNEYFQTLKYVSGFTGSEGKMVITEKNAHLWTDGRYTIQAKEELKGTEIEIHIYSDTDDAIRNLPLFFEASSQAVLDSMLDEDGNLKTNLPKYVIACDGRSFSYHMIEDIIDNLGIAHEMGAVVLDPQIDLVSEIWNNRPLFPAGKISFLDDEYTGEAAESKISKVRKEFNKFAADTGMVITGLDDIAWLYNIRGVDIDYCTTALAYGYINMENAYIFIDAEKLTGRTRQYFKDISVTIKNYDEFYHFLEVTDDKCILIDSDKNNAAIVDTLSERQTVAMLDVPGIIEELKAIKNEVEIANNRLTNIKDAAAVIRFIKWIKENVGKVKITEVSAGEYLNLLRKEQGAYRESFETICAYADHGAIVHYTADKKTDYEIRPSSFLLVDSGGQYKGGTTDITRTIPLGDITDEMKKHYTLVLAGALELADAKFKRGTTGAQLDIICRMPMWKHNMDFDHGTGHGIGNMLNVHEGPQSISWKRANDSTAILPGMITSDEPGYYLENKYGIRHENEILCLEDKNGMLKFESLTMVPFDTSAVDTYWLNDHELELLNKYNADVYSTLAPLLREEEKTWLYNETMPLKRREKNNE